jgi:murein DD-endopeptidase MepM/ murein hydrolase activator NlpD
VHGLLSGLALAAALAAGVAAATTSAPADVLRLDVSHVARAVRPGEVVLLRVRTSAPADAVTGRTPAGSLHFWKTADPLVWEAVAGLDVEAKAGPVRVTVRADGRGSSTEASHVLTVTPRSFPARRITVDPRFANPPASELPRIEREAKRTAAILAVVSPGRQWTGPFGRPVPGPETSAFGRISIVNGERRSPHAGSDLQAAVGTPVRAPNAGTVVLSDALYFSGETVIIDHGLGLFSYLAHLSRRDAAEGDAVTAGEVVGLSGVTGRITGPHLHWSVRVGSARVDPMSLLHTLGAR